MHPARQESFFSMIQGLWLFQSVHLRQLAYGMAGAASLDSKIRRLQRFFQHQDLDYVAIGKLILSLFNLSTPLTLTLDRTDWMYGKAPINILVLGVLIGDMSVPIAFSLLNKKGNSNTMERAFLIKVLLKIIPTSRIDCLLADREFIGKDWFRLLIKQGIPFAIRIKSSTKMKDPRTGKMTTVGQYYRSVRRGDYVIETQIWEQNTYLMFKKQGKSLPNAVFLAVSTKNIRTSWIKKYRKRWSIERMFLSLKTHGFNLEQTHLTKPDRLRKLIAVMAIAFAVCCRIGKFLNEIIPIPIKTHGRRLYSIFTYGLIRIKEQLSKPMNYNRFLGEM